MAWVGLTVESLERARELFTGALQGAVTEDGPGWLRVTWGPGRDLLVRAGGAVPGGAPLWAAGDPGVAHVVFGGDQPTVRQLESGDVRVEPMPFDEATAVPVWLAADGSPGSIVRAGQLGLPLALGIEGGRPSRLAPMLWLYQDVLFEADHPPCPVAITVHGFVADTTQRAAELYYPGDAEGSKKVGGERSTRAARTGDVVDFAWGSGGPYVVGSPEQVTEQILQLHETFGHQRTLLQLASGIVGHGDVMRAIELLGTEVAPAVRSEIARRQAVGSTPRRYGLSRGSEA